MELRRRAAVRLFDYYLHCDARDREIGTVLGALDGPEVLEDTIVLFTSDHGGQFWSHGLYGFEFPFEESVRIPLAIRFPSRIRPGQESAALISHIDILPTLAGLCGISIPENVQGRDLSGLLVGAENGGELPDAVYAAGQYSEPNEWHMLVHGYDKLVTGANGRVTHLYNLSDDPLELLNLADVSAEQRKRDSLVAMQQAWMRKLGDRIDASGLKTR